MNCAGVIGLSTYARAPTQRVFMIRTEAWIIDEGCAGSPTGALALRRGHIDLGDLAENEVLVEPLFGCWEANMSHALDRRPVDVCRVRNEKSAVLGNAGVVRVLKPGPGVTSLRPGTVCMVFCNGQWDSRGYPIKIYAYDAAGTVGVLAKITKLHVRQLIPIPEASRFSLQQWAAFALRYVTAWANWRVAVACWRSQMRDEDSRQPIVWGWGGGVAFAELALAAAEGADVTLISSQTCRLRLIEHFGMKSIDRRAFDGLRFCPERYGSDAEYRSRYQSAEKCFLEAVQERTGGEGVSIFVDYIGAPVYRATLKALGRGGVITTAGWKEGMALSTIRAIECMSWHTHVHTHYARYEEGVEAVQFGERTGWMPPVDGTVYDWQDIPQLAEDYTQNRISTYFPLFAVNAA